MLLQFLPALCMGIISFLSVINVLLYIFRRNNTHGWLAFAGGLLVVVLMITNRNLYNFFGSLERIWFDTTIPFLFLGICSCFLVVFKDFFMQHTVKRQIQVLWVSPVHLITFLAGAGSIILFIFKGQAGEGDTAFNVAVTSTYLLMNLHMVRLFYLFHPKQEKQKPTGDEHIHPHMPQNQYTHAMQKLTGREMEVLGLLSQGLTDKEIGERLFLSVVTIKTHARSIYKKLNVKNRTQAGLIYKQLYNHSALSEN